MSVKRGLGDFLHLIERHETGSYRRVADQGTICTAKAAEAAAQTKEVTNGMRSRGTPVWHIAGNEGSRELRCWELMI